jgi:hypothetical protein
MQDLTPSFFLAGKPEIIHHGGGRIHRRLAKRLIIRIPDHLAGIVG